MQRGTGQKPLGSLLSSAATTLRSLINAPWYVTNETIHRGFKIPTIKDAIYKSRSRYNARDNNHHNPIVTQILHTTDQIRRLKRKYPLEKKKKKSCQCHHKYICQLSFSSSFKLLYYQKKKAMRRLNRSCRVFFLEVTTTSTPSLKTLHLYKQLPLNIFFIFQI